MVIGAHGSRVEFAVWLVEEEFKDKSKLAQIPVQNMEGINALVVNPAEIFNASVYQQIKPRCNSWWFCLLAPRDVNAHSFLVTMGENVLIGIRNVMGIMTVVTGRMSPIVTGKQDMDMSP